MENVKAILGLNGIIWIYFSTVVVEDEYFNDDKTKISIAIIKNGNVLNIKDVK